jgi:hypothetical protein
MIEKTYSIKELTDDFSTRHGFVFASGVKSSDRSIENLANQLKNAKFANVLPEFFVRLSDTVTAFVYPQGEHFESGAFYQIAKNAGHMLGVFEVEMLGAFLKEHS